jgi:Zn-dependent protease with chaperone function
MTTMDFFENQSQAIRRTGLLVLTFCVAVILIIVAVYVVTILALIIATGGFKESSNGWQLFLNFKVFISVAGSILIIVFGSALFKMIELRQGGSAVAMLLGGVPVPLDSKDPNERKLLNVIDEMSLASGCPPPSVFKQDRELSINAFAAGYTPTDAAICVTRGTIEHLTRDELQGVIAHEFSHIVMGDMKLNIRLIGILAGIEQISAIGRMLMVAALAGSHSSRRDRDRGGSIHLIFIGGAIFLVGSIGLFFAKVIKSAVSRQREFLADAAAVQYTRFAPGLAGALKKIGGLTQGSNIENCHAEEASHMFFGNALKSGSMNLSGNMLSTHPKLGQRIKRLEPDFDGDYPQVTPLKRISREFEQHHAPQPAIPTPPPVQKIPGVLPSMLPPNMQGKMPLPSPGVPGAAQLPPPFIAITASAILNNVGQVTPDNMKHAKRVIESLPQDLRQRIRRSGGAQAVLYAVILLEDDVYQEKGLEARRNLIPQESFFEVQQVLEQVSSLDPSLRFPLVDLSLPALRQMPQDETNGFLQAIRILIKADETTTLFEYTIERMVSRQIDPEVRRQQRQRVQFYSIKPLLSDLAVLMSALAYSDETQDAQHAFQTSAETLKNLGKNMKLLSKSELAGDVLTHAFDRLDQCSPPIKKRVLEACIRVVTADNKITPVESELLRAVSENLGCPMPPIG